jgi:hypothetical protein
MQTERNPWTRVKERIGVGCGKEQNAEEKKRTENQ